jgi:hypothetical protein
MKTLEKNNANDAGRMIRTLCVLFLAIVLKNRVTNTFSWEWSMLMIAVIVALFAGNAYVTFLKRSAQRRLSN